MMSEPTAAPVQEPIEGPVTPKAEEAPAWLLGEEAKASRSDKKVNPEEWRETLKDSNDILTSTIRSIHHTAAERMHYPGFELPDDMAKSWKQVFRYIFKKLPPGDWPIMLAGLSLAWGYIQMGMGYFDARKNKDIGAGQEPTKVPRGVSGEPDEHGRVPPPELLV